MSAPTHVAPCAEPSRGPLAGLRVVEFSAFVAAPSAGLALAQLGADVIRVDPPGGSTRITSAPSCASASPAEGAATKAENSTTRSPCSGPRLGSAGRASDVRAVMGG